MEDETRKDEGQRAQAEGEQFDPIALPVADTEEPRLRLGAPKRGKRLAKPESKGRQLTGEQRLLILDSWKRSGLPAGDFAPLVGLSKHTLYLWKQRFEAEGARVIPEPTRRASEDALTAAGLRVCAGSAWAVLSSSRVPRDLRPRSAERLIEGSRHPRQAARTEHAPSRPNPFAPLRLCESPYDDRFPRRRLVINA